MIAMIATTMNRLLVPTSGGWWVANDACAAAVIGILVATFCALQSRRNAQRHRDLGNEHPPPSIGVRLCIVVAILAASAAYACLIAVRLHVGRRSSPTVVPPGSLNPSLTSIDLAIEAAFDEAALLRHVHRGSPGF